MKLACETDFVAKNDTFRALADQIITKLGVLDTLSGYADADQSLKDNLEQILKDNFVTIGENMQILEAFVQSGTTYVYTHPGDKVAAAVFYTGSADTAKAVALQVAAMNPIYLFVDDIPAADVEKYTAEFTAEVADSGKPADIVEKIIAGKLQKIWGEIVLMEQISIIDDSKRVRELLGDTVVERYIRLAI